MKVVVTILLKSLVEDRLVDCRIEEAHFFVKEQTGTSSTPSQHQVDLKAHPVHPPSGVQLTLLVKSIVYFLDAKHTYFFSIFYVLTYVCTISRIGPFWSKYKIDTYRTYVRTYVELMIAFFVMFDTSW